MTVRRRITAVILALLGTLLVGLITLRFASQPEARTPESSRQWEEFVADYEWLQLGAEIEAANAAVGGRSAESQQGQLGPVQAPSMSTPQDCFRQ